MVSRALVRRRSEERGAALFVVVLVLTLLTAVGLFAAQSATLVDQASGYSRQASQTSYLAEYGTLLATTELGSGAASAAKLSSISQFRLSSISAGCSGASKLTGSAGRKSAGS